uniref:Uncharacterized protein n=1 Tax=Tanacetum cinerariifolium TaxID=118510 RepID=A0A699H9W2_TANCI|nr:hypothetical protein [Tanacetum cinerariifolium]
MKRLGYGNSVISISLDVSVEIVRSSFLKVILIGFISVEIPVALEVGAAAVASPARVLELDNHSSSKADTLRHVSPTPHNATLTRWRSRVASRSSSPITSTPEIPTTPILPAPSTVVTPSSDEDIPIGRLYRTYHGGPCRALTTRKSVRPLTSHRLALRYTSHHLDRFTSGSSSGHSSSDHSSFGHSISGHSLSGHTSPDTTIADSSTPPRFVHPPLARTPRSEDSSYESSVGPSRKRCGSPAATRFRDSISPEDSVEEQVDANELADIKADAMTVEAAVDIDVKAGVDAAIGMEVNVGIDIEDEVEDEVESSDRGTMKVGVDVVAGIDIPEEDIETGQRELEARSLISGRQRASLLEQVVSLERSNTRLRGTIMMERARADRFRRRMRFMKSELRKIHSMTITRFGMTPEAIKELFNRRVDEALAAYEATRAANALEAKNRSQNGNEDDNRNKGNGNG